MHTWSTPQLEKSDVGGDLNHPAADEYRPLGVRDQPALYVSVDEPQVTIVPEVVRKPMLPNVPILIECDDQPASNALKASPMATGKHVGLDRNLTAMYSSQKSSLGVSPAAAHCPGGIKTPSRVPKEFQELNFQQIQILIDKLEALKTAGHNDNLQPLSDEIANIEEEHLYDHIPEPEKEDSPKSNRPPLPPKPKPKKQQEFASGVMLKSETIENKPKKSLGECIVIV